MSEETDLKAIAARAEKATQGPWVVSGHIRDGEYAMIVDAHEPAGVVCYLLARTNREEGDKEFIAHARTDIPALLAIVAAQAEEIARVKEALAESERIRSLMQGDYCCLCEALGVSMDVPDAVIVEVRHKHEMEIASAVARSRSTLAKE